MFSFSPGHRKISESLYLAFDLEFKKIHDLPVLLKSCLAIDSNLDLLLDDCIFLNRFYIDTRYPVHWPTRYNKDEALKAKKASENVRETLKNALKSIAPSL